MLLKYLCLLLALLGFVSAVSHSWDNQLGMDVAFVDEDSSTEALEAVSELSDAFNRDLTVADFLKVPFNPTTDARDRLIYESILAEPSFHASRAAAIRMNYYMDVATYDRLHSQTLASLRSLAASLNIPISITNSYSTVLAEVEDAMRKQQNTNKASFAELGAQLGALQSSAYLFEGRYTVMSALEEDVVALGVIKDKIDQAFTWLKNQISANRCSWCKSIVSSIKGRACAAAGKYICTSVLAAVGGVVGSVISKWVCGAPVNFSGILAGWCNKAVSHLQKLTRVTDTCICSFKAGISVPKVTILGKSVGGFTIGSSAQVCKTNPGECAWDKKEDKKKWDGKSGTVDKPITSLGGKIVDATIRAGTNSAIDGVRGAIRNGIRNTVRNLARQGVKAVARRAAVGAGKLVATSAAKTAVSEVGKKAKEVASKGVGKLANATGKIASRVYTRAATRRMNRRAAALRGKAKTDYIRRQTERTRRRAERVRDRVSRVTNFAGQAVSNYAVDKATGNINRKVEAAIKGANRGTARNTASRAKAGLRRLRSVRVSRQGLRNIASRAVGAVRRTVTLRNVGGLARNIAGTEVNKALKTAGEKKIDQVGDRLAARRAARRSSKARVGARVRSAAGRAARRVARTASRARSAARGAARRAASAAKRGAVKARRAATRVRGVARAAARSVARRAASRARAAARRAARAAGAVRRAARAATKKVARARSAAKRAVTRARAAARKAVRRVATRAKRVVRKPAARRRAPARRAAARRRAPARRAAARKRTPARRRAPARKRAAPKKAKAAVVSVSSDADLKAKIKSGRVRVGAVYKKGGACYKLKSSNGKSAKTSCNSFFYF